MRLMRFVILIAVSATALSAQTSSTAVQSALMGFSRDASIRERDLEKQFDSFIDKNDLRDWMTRLSAHPHHLGSGYDRDNANFMAGLFRSWGFDTEIEQFDVLFPTPTTRLLEM